MNLSEKYINKLMSLAGLINENRIDKLKAEKYPPEIIQFAINFAKETTRDNSNEENVGRNQYIPWIASQAKSNPNIMNDRNKINVIIAWIKNSGYNKIGSIENFENVYEKAKEWLKSKNIDLLSGERVEGGKVVKKYQNKFQWIQATEVNWCINAGEQYGWCFNQLNRAEQFVGLGDIGLNNKGYFLINDKFKPIIALQYNSKAKTIIDIQGIRNTPLNAQLLPYAFDLFRMLPEIINIEGHQNSFWNSFNFEGGDKFKQELVNIPNVKFSKNIKGTYGLPFTKKELNSLSVQDKLRFHLPLNQEEINTLSIDDKINHGFATAAELNALPIYKKIYYDIPLTASDYKKINQPILKRVWLVLKKKENPKDLFMQKDFEGFKDFFVDEDGINLSIEEEEYDKKYSGLDEDNRQYSYYDSSEETVEDDELEYMNNYLSEENIDKIKYLASLLGVSQQYNFEESGEIQKFLEEYIENARGIFDEYTTKLGEVIGESKEKEIKDELKKEQKFKYEGGFLVLPWKSLYKFLKEHPITKFKDLENLQINGEINLEDIFINSGSSNLSDENIEYLNNSVGKELDKSLEIFESTPGYSESVDEFQSIIRNLKFEKGNFSIYAPSKIGMPATHKGDAIYKLELPTKTIFIQEVLYVEKKISVFIIEFEDKRKKKYKKMLKGKIHFENLINYTHQYALFEEKIRKDIREILSEGGNFRYSDTNNKETPTFIPSGDVVKTAQQALQVIQKNKLVQADASNEGSGIQKANSLSKAEPMTHAQLKRMEAFFTNNEPAVKQELATGKNINNSPLIQKWNLWGGNAGMNWVRKNMSSQESSNQTSKKIRNPEHGVDTKTLMNPHNTRIHK